MRVPGKVYGRILTERLMKVTEGKVSEDQGGLRKGRGCVDQVYICNEEVSGGVLMKR